MSDRDKTVLADVKPELPLQAVTEAIVNAVCHRDYTSNESVQVMLFKDRLEIWNPGQLPYGLTVKMLKTRHSSRPANPLLARPMYLYGSIEQVGTGTEMIVEKCIEQGLRTPDFIQEENFIVTLWRDKKNINKVRSIEKPFKVRKTVEKILDITVEKTVEKILDIITHNPQITQTKLAEMTGLTRRGIEWNISKLKSKGLLERIGPAKGGYWRVL